MTRLWLALAVALPMAAAALAGCVAGDDVDGGPDSGGGDPASEAPEHVELVGCDEQFGVFTVPVGQAEPYMPEGFEPTGVGGEPLPEGRAGLVVVMLRCEDAATEEELTQLWINLLVDPPEEYDREDAVFKYIPIRFGVTDQTFLDTLHAWGFTQPALVQIDVETDATAPGLESWRTRIGFEDGNAVLETETAGYHPEVGGGTARFFGVDEGEVIGIVDLEATAWEGGIGAVTFEDDGLVPLDVDDAGSGGLALGYDVVVTPVDLPEGG